MRPITFLTALAVTFGCIAGARAQGYPSHPLTMIVPFPAGGPTDTLARILTERMSISLGPPIMSENVPGAGATIGVARAVHAEPDGYTLSIGNWTSHVGSAALYPVQYDLLKDLAPVSLLTTAPLLMVGKNELPASNAKELIAWLRANPDKASAASVGAG